MLDCWSEVAAATLPDIAKNAAALLKQEWRMLSHLHE